jgi:hypothetical protein
MRFEYDTPTDEFVACQLLYYKLSGGRKRVVNAVGWIVAGLALMFIAWSERFVDSAPIILAAIGASWIYAGVASFFPARHFRRAYTKGDYAGKRLTADADADGFEVTGDLYSWRVRWPGRAVESRKRTGLHALFKGNDIHVREEILDERTTRRTSQAQWLDVTE